MARWTGWGAGPAGAGSTGGPSRVFLALALLACLAVAVVTARDRNLVGAAVAAAATVYFALRLFAGLGRGTR
ncbi:MAG TPA: hypothetical protein VF841_22170 [Anaeromyxobacter sp.]